MEKAGLSFMKMLWSIAMRTLVAELTHAAVCGMVMAALTYATTGGG
jgi:hypothetical protein